MLCSLCSDLQKLPLYELRLIRRPLRHKRTLQRRVLPRVDVHLRRELRPDRTGISLLCVSRLFPADRLYLAVPVAQMRVHELAELLSTALSVVNWLQPT